MARGWLYTKPSLACIPLRVPRACMHHAASVLFYGFPARLVILAVLLFCFSFLSFSCFLSCFFNALAGALWMLL